MRPHSDFAPLFEADAYSENDRRLVAPFFTNLDSSVYVPLIMAPELIGALCSRTSRAAGDLRKTYLNEYILPFIKPVRDEKDSDETWNEKLRYGTGLSELVEFLQHHPLTDIFSNPRARKFYATWLAQYGDDSIAQMAGAHLVYTGLSQVAIKHLEDQRIGLAPIEKSTRYVNYGKKTAGQYLYYADPTLQDLGLMGKYHSAMDGLFETYARLIPKLSEWLAKKFPEEKPPVVEKKAFDTLRGLLPNSTLSQVAFFGNGQAFEFMISRSLEHPLGEIRWAGERAYEELARIVPAFLRRIKDEERRAAAREYQTMLATEDARMAPYAASASSAPETETGPRVVLVEHDPDGEAKIIAGMLYDAHGAHLRWETLFEHAKKMSPEKKKEAIAAYLGNRTQRWQRIGRAFENAYNRFEITMNIGAWRDLHRHRMLTQQRQYFTTRHGYDVPPELSESGLEKEFRGAITRAEEVFGAIEGKDPNLAQYAVTLAHRIRFMQWENLRQSIWQIELRTIPEGHPDYRHIEQEKFRLIEKAYPAIAPFIRANMGEYDFARRGQEERIQEKIKKLAQ